MNTEEKYGLKKKQAILLFVQMLLILFQLAVAVYLLVFVIKYNLGGWMISSYIFITISIIAIIIYSFHGYKKNNIIYKLSVIPFMVAVLVNVMLPGREAFQVALLTILFALIFGHILKLEDGKVNYIITISMVVVSLTFSIYSSIKANTQFLGEIDALWTTYLAMYLSIFIPTIMSGTFALISNIKRTRINN